MKKKRGTFLTIWLWLMAVSQVVSFLYLFIFSIGTIPDLVFYYYIASCMVGAIAIILLFQWKKIGFYLVVINVFIGVLISMGYFGSGIYSIFLGVIGVAMLYLAMKPQWNLFK